jgi:hypothetical protein
MIERSDVDSIEEVDLSVGGGSPNIPFALLEPRRPPIGSERTTPVVLGKCRSKQTNNFIL